MRLDAVEVKLNVAPGGVSDALALLGIHGEGTRRAIYFADDPLGNGGTLPLLDAGVVLRVRQAPDGKIDSTVKLRPCRRSQLTDEWLDSPKAGDDDAKLEADWVGDRKVLAASLSAKQDPDKLTDVLAHRSPVGALFSPRQQAFLDACADVRVNINGLVLLGPIEADRWEHVDLDGLEIVAERWRVGTELEFLELSLRASPSAAALAQHTLDGGAHGRGIAIDDQPSTKTKLVLAHLAASAKDLD
jgi:hypothetical protein